MPVTPLTATARSALEGLLNEKQGRYALAADVVEALATYFQARGKGVMDLPFDVDKTNDAAWVREWQAYLRASGISDEAESLLLIEWLRARSAPGGGAVSRQGATKVALETLESNGYKISATAAAALERNLSASEAGDEDAQCCNARLAFRLLTNKDPTPAQAAWWQQQFAALASLEGGSGIDIPGLEEYQKLHKPSNSSVQLLTLERALQREVQFNEWLMQMVRALEINGLPKAAIRLMMVVSQASLQAAGQWEPKRAYLTGYFFREFRGLGLPKILGSASALSSMGAFASAQLKAPVASLEASSFFAPMGQPAGGPGVGESVVASSVDLAALARASLSGSDGASQAGSMPSAGPSASSVGMDVQSLVSAVTSAVKAAMLERPGGGEATEKPGGGGSGTRRCPYCRRNICPMLEDSSKLCRAATEALKLLKAQGANDDDKKSKGE